MFRIDRNFVNIGAARYHRTIQISSEADVAGKTADNCEKLDAVVAGGSPDAAVSSASASKSAASAAKSAATTAKDIISSAEIEAKSRANEIITEAMAKAEREAESKAEALIGEARREADELKREASEQIEEERERARQDGYIKGEQEGKRLYDERLEVKLREVGEELENKVRDDDEKLNRVIGELYEERTKTYSGLEEQVISLSLDIVRKVINPSEEGFGGVFEMLIRNALKQINPDGKIIIRVSPAEYERFFSSGGAVFELDRGVTVTASVLRDVSLGEGDCVIDTEGETINAGLDTQLKFVRLAFEKANVN